MRYTTYKTVKTIEEKVDIASGKVLETRTLHQECNLKNILRNMGFIFDRSGNNPFYSKALRMQRKGFLLNEVIHEILLQLEESSKLPEGVSV
jgi:hypothetical protein